MKRLLVALAIAGVSYFLLILFQSPTAVGHLSSVLTGSFFTNP
jgi:hypothetical protein